MKKSFENIIQAGPWPNGIDNAHDPSRLRPGYLTAATNVDIDDMGTVSMRDGISTVSSLSAHSLWSDGNLLCYFVHNDNLMQLMTDYTAVKIADGVGSAPMSYAKVGNRVYCANGMKIFYVEDGTAYDIPATTQRNKHPLPIGQLIEYYMGRLYVASNNVLWYSDAIFHTRVDMRKNFKQFRSKILMLRAVTGGMFISDSEATYYMSGDIPERMRLTTVFDYPAIPGSDVMINGEDYGNGNIIGKIAIWSSKYGVCLGLPGGEVRNITQNRYVMPSGVRGAGFYRVTTKGTKQYVTVLQS